MKKYLDTESGAVLTEAELLVQFENLRNDNPDEYPYNFAAYIRNCTDKNGFLVSLG